MSHNGHHLDHHSIEALGGAAAELLTQGGHMHGQVGTTVHRALTGTHAGHTAATAVQSLSKYAPGAVVAVGAVAPPVAIAVGVVYAGYRLFKWLKDEC